MVITDKHFYEVCRLFLGVAISDLRLHDIEKDMVIKAISDYWQLLRSNDTSNPLAPENYGESMFKTISQEDANAWELFDSFENYYRENQNEFSNESKQWIIAKANEIASSYARKNKSEIVLVARLRLLFNKT